MKRLFILLFCIVPLLAQTTTVTQPVMGADLGGANGRGSIQISQPCISGSNYVSMAPIPVTVTGGVFSVNLVPNDTCIPLGTSYAVTWQMSSQTPGNSSQYTETWVVPTSATPVTVGSVIVNAPPASSFVIP